MSWAPPKVVHTMESLLARGVKQPNGCITIGSDAPTRYWMVKHNGKQIHAHRLMLMLKLGGLEPKQCACHHCDNPRCINPDHLFAATHSENMGDCNAKGRRNYHKATKKLQPHEVDAAKYLIKAGFRRAHIANFLGVHEQTIIRISTGATHKATPRSKRRTAKERQEWFEQWIPAPIAFSFAPTTSFSASLKGAVAP